MEELREGRRGKEERERQWKKGREEGKEEEGEGMEEGLEGKGGGEEGGGSHTTTNCGTDLHSFHFVSCTRPRSHQ